MRSVVDNALVRLFVYYAGLLVLFNGVILAFPWIEAAVLRERARAVTSVGLDPSSEAAFAPSGVPLTDLEVLAPIVLTLLGALGLALPVAFVYQWTREPEEYRRDFGRALIALPIAVALAVFLVKNSLALAFSLAGIVAAIRWRSALRETMDGVFVFVVIGIGLAAGVQLLMVALVASVLFNALILALARYAAEPRQLSGWTLTAAAPPRPAEPPRTVGVQMDVADPARAEAQLGAVFALCAKTWEKTATAPLPDGRVRLAYRVTLKKKCTTDALRNAVQSIGMPEVGGVLLTAEG